MLGSHLARTENFSLQSQLNAPNFPRKLLCRGGACPACDLTTKLSHDLDPAYGTLPDSVPATPMHHAENGDENENLDGDFEDNGPGSTRLYLYLARPMLGQAATRAATLACQAKFNNDERQKHRTITKRSRRMFQRSLRRSPWSQVACQCGEWHGALQPQPHQRCIPSTKTSRPAQAMPFQARMARRHGGC
ncbi:hypothetical protein FIBSPDRAFT_135759 [Athelia psychrophila]|uniref:Uncharacterized protein n=1 Tax=Athelia psychrophila TaxID=1759441 RepID=A0A166C6Z2_9AGAM|nr:hypothetical protein FIBSPDRAFT_135759 [Fibularhizoctonia sp. CBS 109695]